MGSPSPITCPRPGIYPGVPDATYRQWDAVNQSSLKDQLKSGADMVFRKGHPRKPTADMIQGLAIHTCILEPDLFAERYVWTTEKREKRSKDDKKWWADFEKEAAADGKQILTLDQYHTSSRCRDAVLEHPRASEILQQPGDAEVCAVWQYNEQTTCKQKMDRLSNDRRTIVDVKSCVSAERGAFWGQSRRLKYHMQAAFYRDGVGEIEQIPGFEITYLLIAVEKSGRYAVAVYCLDADTLARGWELYVGAMESLIECRESGVWPGYNDDKIATIGVASNPDAGDENGSRDTDEEPEPAAVRPDDEYGF